MVGCSRHILLLCILLAYGTVAFGAGNIEFISEYTYRAGEMDSKISSRALALQEVKRSLLERLGTYLIVETEVREYRMTKDQIITVSAGVVGAEILQERWDGATYYMQAKITVDPEAVAKQIKAIGSDRERMREIEEAKRKVDAALKEISRLQQELRTIRPAHESQRPRERQQDERRKAEREFKYARAIQDLEEDVVFSGYLFTLKDGSTFIWKQYEEVDENYCHDLAAGRVCVPTSDVATIRRGEYPAGAEVISTPPVDDRSRRKAEGEWKSVQSDNEQARRDADCQRIYNALQEIADKDRYQEEYLRYSDLCSGARVERSATERRRTNPVHAPATRSRERWQRERDDMPGN